MTFSADDKYKGLKFLHIISDEKFPDAAYIQFERVAPGSNTFLLPNKNLPIKYLNLIKPIRVSPLAYLNPLFIKSLNQYDAVILHSLKPFSLELVGRADRDVVFIWIGMG